MFSSSMSGGAAPSRSASMSRQQRRGSTTSGGGGRSSSSHAVPSSPSLAIVGGKGSSSSSSSRIGTAGRGNHNQPLDRKTLRRIVDGALPLEQVEALRADREASSVAKKKGGEIELFNERVTNKKKSGSDTAPPGPSSSSSIDGDGKKNQQQNLPKGPTGKASGGAAATAVAVVGDHIETAGGDEAPPPWVQRSLRIQADRKVEEHRKSLRKKAQFALAKIKGADEAVNIARLVAQEEAIDRQRGEDQSVDHQVERFVRLEMQRRCGEGAWLPKEEREAITKPETDDFGARVVERHTERTQADRVFRNLEPHRLNSLERLKLLKDEDLEAFGHEGPLLESKSDVQRLFNQRDVDTRVYVSQQLAQWSQQAIARSDFNDLLDVRLAEMKILPDGAVSVPELKELLSRCKVKLAPATMVKLLNRLDARGEGRIRIETLRQVWLQGDLIPRYLPPSEEDASAGFDAIHPPQRQQHPISIPNFINFIAKIGAQITSEDVEEFLPSIGGSLHKYDLFSEENFPKLQDFWLRAKSAGTDAVSDGGMLTRLQELELNSGSYDAALDQVEQSSAMMVHATQKMSEIKEGIHEQAMLAGKLSQLLPARYTHTVGSNTDVTIGQSNESLWGAIVDDIQAAKSAGTGASDEDAAMKMLQHQLRCKNEDLVKLMMHLQSTKSKTTTTIETLRSRLEVIETENFVLKEQVDQMNSGMYEQLDLEHNSQVNQLLTNLRKKLRSQEHEHEAEMRQMARETFQQRERADAAEHKVSMLTRELQELQSSSDRQTTDLKEEIRHREYQMTNTSAIFKEYELKISMLEQKHKEVSEQYSITKSQNVMLADQLDTLRKVQANMVPKAEMQRRIEEAVGKLNLELGSEAESKNSIAKQLHQVQNDQQKKALALKDEQARGEATIASLQLQVDVATADKDAMQRSVLDMGRCWLDSLCKMRSSMTRGMKIEEVRDASIAATSDALGAFTGHIKRLADREELSDAAGRLMTDARQERSREFLAVSNSYHDQIVKLKSDISILEAESVAHRQRAEEVHGTDAANEEQDYVMAECVRGFIHAMDDLCQLRDATEISTAKATFETRSLTGPDDNGRWIPETTALRRMFGTVQSAFVGVLEASQQQEKRFAAIYMTPGQSPSATPRASTTGADKSLRTLSTNEATGSISQSALWIARQAISLLSTEVTLPLMKKLETAIANATPAVPTTDKSAKSTTPRVKGNRRKAGVDPVEEATKQMLAAQKRLSTARSAALRHTLKGSRYEKGARKVVEVFTDMYERASTNTGCGTTREWGERLLAARRALARNKLAHTHGSLRLVAEVYVANTAAVSAANAVLGRGGDAAGGATALIRTSADIATTTDDLPALAPALPLGDSGEGSFSPGTSALLGGSSGSAVATPSSKVSAVAAAKAATKKIKRKPAGGGGGEKGVGRGSASGGQRRPSLTPPSQALDNQSLPADALPRFTSKSGGGSSRPASRSSAVSSAASRRSASLSGSAPGAAGGRQQRSQSVAAPSSAGGGRRSSSPSASVTPEVSPRARSKSVSASVGAGAAQKKKPAVSPTAAASNRQLPPKPHQSAATANINKQIAAKKEAEALRQRQMLEEQQAANRAVLDQRQSAAVTRTRSMSRASFGRKATATPTFSFPTDSDVDLDASSPTAELLGDVDSVASEVFLAQQASDVDGNFFSAPTKRKRQVVIVPNDDGIKAEGDAPSADHDVEVRDCGVQVYPETYDVEVDAFVHTADAQCGTPPPTPTPTLQPRAAASSGAGHDFFDGDDDGFTEEEAYEEDGDDDEFGGHHHHGDEEEESEEPETEEDHGLLSVRTDDDERGDRLPFDKTAKPTSAASASSHGPGSQKPPLRRETLAHEHSAATGTGLVSPSEDEGSWGTSTRGGTSATTTMVPPIRTSVYHLGLQRREDDDEEESRGEFGSVLSGATFLDDGNNHQSDHEEQMHRSTTSTQYSYPTPFTTPKGERHTQETHQQQQALLRGSSTADALLAASSDPNTKVLRGGGANDRYQHRPIGSLPLVNRGCHPIWAWPTDANEENAQEGGKIGKKLYNVPAPSPKKKKQRAAATQTPPIVLPEGAGDFMEMAMAAHGYGDNEHDDDENAATPRSVASSSVVSLIAPTPGHSRAHSATRGGGVPSGLPTGRPRSAIADERPVVVAGPTATTHDDDDDDDDEYYRIVDGVGGAGAHNRDGRDVLINATTGRKRHYRNPANRRLYGLRYVDLEYDSNAMIGGASLGGGSSSASGPPQPLATALEFLFDSMPAGCRVVAAKYCMLAMFGGATEHQFTSHITQFHFSPSSGLQALPHDELRAIYVDLVVIGQALLWGKPRSVVKPTLRAHRQRYAAAVAQVLNPAPTLHYHHRHPAGQTSDSEHQQDRSRSTSPSKADATNAENVLPTRRVPSAGRIGSGGGFRRPFSAASATGSDHGGLGGSAMLKLTEGDATNAVNVTVAAMTTTDEETTTAGDAASTTQKEPQQVVADQTQVEPLRSILPPEAPLPGTEAEGEEEVLLNGRAVQSIHALPPSRDVMRVMGKVGEQRAVLKQSADALNDARRLQEKDTQAKDTSSNSNISGNKQNHQPSFASTTAGVTASVNSNNNPAKGKQTSSRSRKEVLPPLLTGTRCGTPSAVAGGGRRGVGAAGHAATTPSPTRQEHHGQDVDVDVDGAQPSSATPGAGAPVVVSGAIPPRPLTRTTKLHPAESTALVEQQLAEAAERARHEHLKRKLNDFSSGTNDVDAFLNAATATHSEADGGGGGVLVVVKREKNTASTNRRAPQEVLPLPLRQHAKGASTVPPLVAQSLRELRRSGGSSGSGSGGGTAAAGAAGGRRPSTSNSTGGGGSAPLPTAMPSGGLPIVSTTGTAACTTKIQVRARLGREADVRQQVSATTTGTRRPMTSSSNAAAGGNVDVGGTGVARDGGRSNSPSAALTFFDVRPVGSRSPSPPSAATSAMGRPATRQHHVGGHHGVAPWEEDNTATSGSNNNGRPTVSDGGTGAAAAAAATSAADDDDGLGGLLTVVGATASTTANPNANTNSSAKKKKTSPLPSQVQQSERAKVNISTKKKPVTATSSSSSGTATAASGGSTGKSKKTDGKEAAEHDDDTQPPTTVTGGTATTAVPHSTAEEKAKKGGGKDDEVDGAPSKQDK